MTTKEESDVLDKTADSQMEKSEVGDDTVKEVKLVTKDEEQEELTLIGEEELDLMCEEDADLTGNEELYTTAHEGNVTGDEEVDDTVQEETGDKSTTAKEGEKQYGEQSAEKPKKQNVIRIYDQVGTIFQSGRYESILVQFQYNGRDEVAMASTRSMYINGSHSLLGICKRDVMLKGFLRDGDSIHFDAASTEAIMGINKGRQKNWYKQPYHSWDIVLMWKGPKPDLWRLNTGLKFDAEEEYLDAKKKHLEVLLKEDEELKKKKKDCKTMHGEIKEFLSATHGTMSSGGSTIVFKSEDLFLGGMKMKEGQTLADVLQSGEKVSAFVKEKPLEYGSVTYTLQATSIWKKDKEKKMIKEIDIGVPECWFLVSTHCTKRRLPGYDETTEKDQVGVIKEIHRPKGGIISLPSGKDVLFARTRLYVNNKKLGMNDILEDAVEIGDTVHCNIISNEEQLYVEEPVSHVALLVWKGEKPEANWQPAGEILQGKVLKLDHPQENGVSSGILVVSGPEHAGKKAAFDRNSTYFYGLSLAKADLAYILEKDDTLFCTIEVMPENEGGKVTHKASVAWVGSASGPNITDNTDIKLSKFQMMRYLRRASLDVDTFEMLLSGQLEPKHKRHVPLMPLPLGTVTARMVALNPPLQDGAVISADLSLEFQCGDRGGHRLRMHRDCLHVWGIPMDKADISYLFQKGDRVFCNIKEATDLEGVKYKTTFAWIGPRPNSDSGMNLETLGKDKNFNEWLNRLSLTMDQISDVVQGKMAPRMFIPFKSESMTARIISVDPPKKNGIQSGTVFVQKGSLEGKYVTFHRKSVYVCGHNMAKADLGYILLEGDIFVCEIERIFHREEIRLQVILMWNWSRRPTHNPEENVSSNLAGFENWLRKRGLSMSNFKKLVEGKLSPLPVEDILVPILRHDREWERQAPRIFSPDRPRRLFRKESQPPPPVHFSPKDSLWKFKKRITECKRKMSHLLLTAMNITSLDEPILDNIIQDKEVAEMTEFVSKGFSVALKMFNSKKKGQKRIRPPVPSARYRQVEKPSRSSRPPETKEHYSRDDGNRGSYHEHEDMDYLGHGEKVTYHEDDDHMEYEGSNRVTASDGARRTGGTKPGYRDTGARTIYHDVGGRADHDAGGRAGYSGGAERAGYSGDRAVRAGYREGGTDMPGYREGGGDRSGYRDGSGAGGERPVYREGGGGDRPSYRDSGSDRPGYRDGSGNKPGYFNTGVRAGHPVSGGGGAGFQDGRERAGYPEGGERLDFPPVGSRGDFPPGGSRPDFPPGGSRPNFPPGGNRPDFPPEGNRSDFLPSVDRPGFPPGGNRTGFPQVASRTIYPQGGQRAVFPSGVERIGHREGGERTVYREGGNRVATVPGGSRAGFPQDSNRDGYNESWNRVGVPPGGDRADYPPSGDWGVNPQNAVRVVYRQGGDRGVLPPVGDRAGYPQDVGRVVYRESSDRAVYPQSGDRPGYREAGDRSGFPHVGERAGFRESGERSGFPEVGERPRYAQRMVRAGFEGGERGVYHESGDKGYIDGEERKRQRGPEDWAIEPQRKWFRTIESRDTYQLAHGYPGSFKRATNQADVGSYY